MQDARAELNRPLLPAVLGLGAVAAAVGCVALARLPLAPTPEQCLGGDHDALQRHLVALGAAGGAGGLAIAMGFLLRPLRAAGGFARVVAAALAAGLPPCVAAVLPAVPVSAYAVVAAAAAGAGGLAGRVLFERGLLSLALGTAVAALPTLLAVRIARLQAAAARPLAALQESTAPAVCPATQVAVLLDRSLDEATARALPLALRAPFVATPRELLAATADSLPARWLLRMELPAFVLGRGGCSLAPGGPARARLDKPTLAVQAGLERDAAGAPAGLWVQSEQARDGCVVAVFTPCGELVLPLASAPRTQLAGALRQQFARWLRPLPAGLPIRVLVVAPATADAYGWTEVRT